jgi:magnesium chelatase subunit I
LLEEQMHVVKVHPLAEDLIEQIAFEARGSEYVDSKSGVSARLTISAFENLVSAAERRALMNGEKKTMTRIADFWGVVPSITGKIELVYEGEQEGPANVAQILIGKAIRTLFINYFPNPETSKKAKDKNPYNEITQWFGQGNKLDLMNDLTDTEYRKRLNEIPGLGALVTKYHKDAGAEEKLFLMEFALHGLAEFSMLSKARLERGVEFKDLLSGMFTMGGKDMDDDF